MNKDLEELFQEDQAERTDKSIDWSDASYLEKMTRRDQMRRQQVEQMLARGEIKKVADYFHAAMVFQHGNTPEDFQKANELAKKAIELGDTEDIYYRSAKWLYAASMDRWLLSLGKAQKYGTQFTKGATGEYELRQPIDPNVTDEERAKYFVPPLSEALEKFKENQTSGE